MEKVKQCPSGCKFLTLIRTSPIRLVQYVTCGGYNHRKLDLVRATHFAYIRCGDCCISGIPNKEADPIPKRLLDKKKHHPRVANELPECPLSCPNRGERISNNGLKVIEKCNEYGSDLSNLDGKKRRLSDCRKDKCLERLVGDGN